MGEVTHAPSPRLGPFRPDFRSCWAHEGLDLALDLEVCGGGRAGVVLLHEGRALGPGRVGCSGGLNPSAASRPLIASVGPLEVRGRPVGVGQDVLGATVQGGAELAQLGEAGPDAGVAQPGAAQNDESQQLRRLLLPLET